MVGVIASLRVVHSFRKLYFRLYHTQRKTGSHAYYIMAGIMIALLDGCVKQKDYRVNIYGMDDQGRVN